VTRQNPTPRRTAVLLDPHPLWLDAVSQVMARADIDVIGMTTSRDEAIALLEANTCDVLVTELFGFGDDDRSIAWLEEVRSNFAKVRILVLSMDDSRGRIGGALAAGATAYVLKTTHPDDLAAAVRQSFEHSIYLRRADVSVQPAPEPARSDSTELLTTRELEILRLAAEGLANAELAKMLWVTEQTVKFHLSNIYRKLDVSNRTEASRWAQLNGLLPTASRAASVA
jgi:DNA-binding NarL/FixJ family response regulator